MVSVLLAQGRFQRQFQPLIGVRLIDASGLTSSEPRRPAVVSAWGFMADIKVETRGAILKPWLHSLLSRSDRSGFSSA